MIKIGENPEKTKGINKFIGTDGEGHRGIIIARKSNKKEAIILAETSGTTVEWGNLYLIKEHEADHYPVVVKRVMRIPNESGWKILIKK